jgi:hypothetical protein
VTWGVVVVVVGATVVVGDDVPSLDELPAVVVVVDVDALVELDVVSDTVVAELEPGCSLATTTPISAVAPVAASTADRVRRRRRTRARSRPSGVGPSLERVMGGTFSLGTPLSDHCHFDTDAKSAVDLL